MKLAARLEAMILIIFALVDSILIGTVFFTSPPFLPPKQTILAYAVNNHVILRRVGGKEMLLTLGNGAPWGTIPELCQYSATRQKFRK